MELYLIVEKGHISHNDNERIQNQPNVKVKIDLMSDQNLFNANKTFQEVTTKLKNQMMKVFFIDFSFVYFEVARN